MNKKIYMAPEVELIRAEVQEGFMLGATDNNGTEEKLKKQEIIEDGGSVDDGDFVKGIDFWDTSSTPWND